MNLSRLGHYPRLFFLCRPRGGQSVLSYFDADCEAELVVSGKWRQARTCGCEACQTGTELRLEVDVCAGPGRILAPLLKGRVGLTGGHSREARQVEGISFQGLVCAEGRDDDGDGGDGALEDLRVDGNGGIVYVVAHLGMA